MNLITYIYTRFIKRQPYPGWFELYNFSISKRIWCKAEISMSWGFGVMLRKTLWPFDATLDWWAWKIHGTIYFGKSKIS